MTTTITVLGATGGIGAAISAAAEQRKDLRVRAVNRAGNATVAMERLRWALEMTFSVMP